MHPWEKINALNEKQHKREVLKQRWENAFVSFGVMNLLEIILYLCY